jgi:sucrose-6-phosphate hydrolase SacC (GH32 family)
VESPSVVYDGAIFHMYYTGVNDAWTPQMGHATSPDGINWTKDSQNPILKVGPAGSWDASMAGVGTVLKRGNEFQMFYSSPPLHETTNPSIGVAYSTDGTTWTKEPNNPIVNSTTAGCARPYNPTALFDTDLGKYFVWYESGCGFGLVTSI